VLRFRPVLRCLRAEVGQSRWVLRRVCPSVLP
jgi:hypothetical protein